MKSSAVLGKINIWTRLMEPEVGMLASVLRSFLMLKPH